MKSPLLALCVAALFAASAHARSLQQAATPIKWCIPAAATAAQVAACTAALAPANTAGATFTCVAGGSEEECLAMVKAGTADLITLGAESGGEGILAANEQFQLEPLAAEVYGDGLSGAKYYGVALVNKELCTPGVTLASLKGKRSCHTGYRRNVGWTMPVGYMVEEGVISAINPDATVNADAESAAAFFSAICAPSDDGALAAGGKWDGVCSACKGDCTTADPYADYAGAVRCLMEGAGDVAFTKHSTAIDYAKDGTQAQPWSAKLKADMRLLCPTGGCKTLDEFESCNLATAPAYPVMTRADFRSSAQGKAAQDALVAAGKNATFLAGAINIGGVNGMAFSDDTKGILAVTSPFIQYFGATTKAAFDGIAKLEQTPATPAAGAAATPAAPATGAAAAALPAAGAGANAARWCIPFAADPAVITACNTAVAKGNTADVTFTCVAGGSKEACQDLIRRGSADLLLLGGADQLPAHEEYGLEPIAAEYYGDLAGASYYSVAVVPKEMCTDGVTLKSLKGKKACHTGYRKTAGWMLPVGTLVEDGVIPRVDGNDQVQADAESVASFFSAVCAPGTNDGPMLSGGKWDGLCTACKGDCSTSDPYADYPGALRCMMEGAGDVAFTKHSTAMEVTSDGSKPEAWSTKRKDDLRLMCPTGGCAPLDQFESCNLGKVPARAVMTRADMKAGAMGKAVQSALTAGGPALVESMTSIGGQKDFIFGETAQSVLAVDVPFIQYYGQPTKAAYDGITSLDTLAASMEAGGASTAGTSSSSSSGSSGVSSGAAAGIGIGCAVAGALIGAGITYFVSKKKHGWQKHGDITATGSAAPSMAYKM